jgi:flavin reductase (DIM6/NTAB) family NADH-FMN oxidoreductase RutF
MTSARLRTASAPPAADKFAGLTLTAGLGGAPLLASPPAALFECRRLDAYPGGDHLILLGEVERYSHSVLPPLVFYGGRYAGVAEVPKASVAAFPQLPPYICLN